MIHVETVCHLYTRPRVTSDLPFPDRIRNVLHRKILRAAAVEATYGTVSIKGYRSEATRYYAFLTKGWCREVIIS